MSRIGFYSGSFDPITNGHTNIIQRALNLVDVLVVGVGVHHGKVPLFSAEERITMIEAEARTITRKRGGEVRVVTFDGLVVDAAREHGANVIIRGLRDGTDFDYEMQMAGMNGAMAPGLETVFLAASPDTRHIAASLVRQIAMMGGNVAPFVSSAVARKLKARIKAKV